MKPFIDALVAFVMGVMAGMVLMQWDHDRSREQKRAKGVEQLVRCSAHEPMTGLCCMRPKDHDGDHEIAILDTMTSYRWGDALIEVHPPFSTRWP